MPIQQMFLGSGAAGDKYWFQKLHFGDEPSNDNTNWPADSGWEAVGVGVDADENSYFLCRTISSYMRPYVIGFDKDGTNIVKSYGGDFANAAGSVVAAHSLGIESKKLAPVFNNRVYYVGKGSSASSPHTWIHALDVTSGQTPDLYKRYAFSKSGNSTDHAPEFITGRFPDELVYSVNFDGTDDRLSVPDSTDLEVGNGDFTVEAWIKQSNDAGSGGDTAHTICSKGGSTANEFAFKIIDSSGNKLQFMYTNDGSTDIGVTGNTTIGKYRWHHVAVTGSSGTLRLFVDGILQSSTGTQGTIASSSGALAIGSRYNNSNSSYDGFFDGRISNLRITKGQALYTADFATSVSPFTTTSQSATSSNVKLICCNTSTVTGSTVTTGTISSSSSPSAAKDCPLGGSLLVGGSLKRSNLNPTNNSSPYCFKIPIDSGLSTVDYANSIPVTWAKREDGTQSYAQYSNYSDAAITSDGAYAWVAGRCSDGGAGNGDVYLVKINYTTGAVISRYGWGSNQYEAVKAVKIDSSGNVYIAGDGYISWAWTNFIMKINSSGTVQWTKKLDNVRSIENLAIDSSDNVYGCGYNDASSNKCGVVFKIDTNGDLDWMTKITVPISGSPAKVCRIYSLDIAGDNENLFFSFDYDLNPSGSESATYPEFVAAIKMPNTGDITGSYGDLTFADASDEDFDTVSLSTTSHSIGQADEEQQTFDAWNQDSYSNGAPTLTKTDL